MSLILKDRVRSNTTTTGTGTVTLSSGTITGYQNFSAIGDNNQTYYIIKGTTEWEVGKGTYTSSGTTLSRDVVFTSSNSDQLVNFSAGTKEVFCIYPLAGSVGGVPFRDDNEIGTDFSGWKSFQAALNESIGSEVAFNNGGVAGVVSTYSLIFTSSQAYSGGVLAPNGDIHFVPFVANRGQTINTCSGSPLKLEMCLSPFLNKF